MKTEKSCGAVVFTRENGEIRYVIIREREGFYSFPKGHIEDGETEEQTALREIREETGLDVEVIDGFRTEDSHPLVREGKPNVIKLIVYFLAEYAGQKLTAQPEEISDISLMSYDQAMESFQYVSSRRILTEAKEFIMTNL